MTRILFVGDTHGDMKFLILALQRSADLKCDAMFQLGDFGFLWPKRDQMENVWINTRQWRMPVFWIDGNHDWHPEIRARVAPQDYWGDPEPGIHHVRRGCSVTIGNLKICGMGGAASIDRDHRVEGQSWWPEETLIPEDLQRVPNGGVDILACHDAPEMPPGFDHVVNEGYNIRSENNRDLVQSAWRRSGAPLLIHGHWHKRYTATGIEGLAHNGAPSLEDSTLLIEKTADGKVIVG